MRVRIRFLPLWVALLLLVAFGTGSQCAAGTAVYVVDGDTFHLRVEAPLNWGADCPIVPGETYRVRLIGVDTPEVHGEIECYGPEASAYARSLIEGRAVCLMRDASCSDRYGRLLAYVWVDTDSSTPGCETFLNGDLVWRGYARAASYPPDTLLLPSLLEAECDAYRNRRGMWSGVCPELRPPPYCPVEAVTPLP